MQNLGAAMMQTFNTITFSWWVNFLFRFMMVLLAVGGINACAPMPDSADYLSQTLLQARVTTDNKLDSGAPKYYIKADQDVLASHSFASGGLKTGNAETGLTEFILMEQGVAYLRLTQYHNAERRFKQVIELSKQIDLISLVRAYANLGSAYHFQSKYVQSLSAYSQALENAQQLENPPTSLLAGLHSDISMVHAELGDYFPAVLEINKALDLLDCTDDKKTKGRTLHQLGYVHLLRGLQEDNKGIIEESNRVFRQALVLRRESEDLDGEGKTLNNIGFSYAKLGMTELALENLQKALEISTGLSDRANVGRTSDSIGTVYLNKADYSRALDYFLDALLIAQEIGDRDAERTILSNIGKTFHQQANPQLAIVFLKHSVDVIEQMRRDLQPLPASTLRSYTESVAGTYRLLANLLLLQKRPLEAERVIDLLRVEELRGYLGQVRGNGAQLLHLPGEQEVREKYSTLLTHSIGQAKELIYLEAIPLDDRTTTQLDRINQIRIDQENAKKMFRRFSDSPEIQKILKDRRIEKQIEAVQLDQLQNLSKKLSRDEVAFYPFVLPDRLELIFVTANSVPIHFSQPVPEQKLDETVIAFRQALINRSDEAKLLGEQLYKWLLEPLENAQKKLVGGDTIKTIVYLPDGILRYIPLAALHDGKDWLARKYGVNDITANSLMELNRQPTPIVNVLAGAFTMDREIDVAGDHLKFDALPYARTEVKDIKALYPQARVYYDDTFKPENFVHSFRDYQLVHMATHAEFVPGRAKADSFILFGDGKRASLSDIQDTWLLPGVELIVLSACQTAVGGVVGNGEEIHGFGYLMQIAGANAILASLWKVSDGGTQTLMSNFYRFLNQPGISKSEALRQAQLALIDNKFAPEVESSARAATPLDENGVVPSSYSHPFYWAPFVLIGNGR